MSTRTPEVNRVDFLSGEIHALFSFALAVAKTHSDREVLAAHFEGASQAALAHIEPTSASDSTISGFRFVADQLLATIRE